METSINVAAKMQPIFDVVCLSNDGSERFLNFFTRCKTEKSLWNRLKKYLSYDEQMSDDALEIYELKRPDKFDLRTFREWYQASTLPPDFQWTNFDDDIYSGGDPYIYRDDLVPMSVSIPTPVSAPMPAQMLAPIPMPMGVVPSAALQRPVGADGTNAPAAGAASNGARGVGAEAEVAESTVRPEPVLSAGKNLPRPEPVIAIDADPMEPAPVAVLSSSIPPLGRAMPSSVRLPHGPTGNVESMTGPPIPQTMVSADIQVKATSMLTSVKMEPITGCRKLLMGEESKLDEPSFKRRRSDNDPLSILPAGAPHPSRVNVHPSSHMQDVNKNKSTSTGTGTNESMKHQDSAMPNQLMAVGTKEAKPLRMDGQKVASPRSSEPKRLKHLLQLQQGMNDRLAVPPTTFVDDNLSTQNSPPPPEPWSDDESVALLEKGQLQRQVFARAPTDGTGRHAQGNQRKDKPSVSFAPIPRRTSMDQTGHHPQRHQHQHEHRSRELQHQHQQQPRSPPVPGAYMQANSHKEVSPQTPESSAFKRDAQCLTPGDRIDRPLSSGRTKSSHSHTQSHSHAQSHGHSRIPERFHREFVMTLDDAEPLVSDPVTLTAHDNNLWATLAKELSAAYSSRGGESLVNLDPCNLPFPKGSQRRDTWWFRTSKSKAPPLFGERRVPPQYRLQECIATILFGHNFMVAPFNENARDNRFTANYILNRVIFFEPDRPVARIDPEFLDLLATVKNRRKLQLSCGEVEVVIIRRKKFNSHKPPYLLVLFPTRWNEIWIGSPGCNKKRPINLLCFR